MKEPISNPILRSWISLNNFIIVADEQACYQLLEEEQKGRNRKQFVKRIHSRLNRVRAARERSEIDGAKPKNG